MFLGHPKINHLDLMEYNGYVSYSFLFIHNCYIIFYTLLAGIIYKTVHGPGLS